MLFVRRHVAGSFAVRFSLGPIRVLPVITQTNAVEPHTFTLQTLDVVERYDFKELKIESDLSFRPLRNYC
jgi:hypothetical protein